MYTRNCPKCGRELNYKNKRCFNFAKKQNTNCILCRSIGINKGKKRTEEQRWEMSKRVSGFNNPFYDKKHTEETKNLLKDYNLGKTYSKEINKSKGRKGRMPWNNGKQMSDEFKLKISKSSSGKNNPMYGKPSPTGSGNGWSGWYKGWYFRSLKELSFMIYYIERFGFQWETGENKKYQIKYMDNDRGRNYYPDFLLNKKYLIEVKPRKLWNSRFVKLKKEAANIFCLKKGLKYKLIDPIKIISKEELQEKIQIGELKFLEKYQIKFNNYEL